MIINGNLKMNMKKKQSNVISVAESEIQEFLPCASIDVEKKTCDWLDIDLIIAGWGDELESVCASVRVRVCYQYYLFPSCPFISISLLLEESTKLLPRWKLPFFFFERLTFLISSLS